MGLEPLLPEQVMWNYFRAKDANRPHILDQTFERDATVEIQNSSTAMSFPAVTRGRAAIAEVLVRSFGTSYENVYTFCLQRPAGTPREFTSEWVVAMTEKATGAVRIGCGRYRWTFSNSAPHLASALLIVISAMTVLPPSTMSYVYAWLGRLSYPWTSREVLLQTAPDHSELQAVLSRLSADQNDA